MPDPITITEDIDSGALTVTLDGPDMPHAWPYEQAGFESGGPVERQKKHLPGLRKPIIQVQQPRERDFVLRGAFRCALHLREGGTDTDHARAMRDALEELRYRCNPLTITWGTQSRKAFLADARFGEESPLDITYELTFDVVEGVGRPERRPAEESTREPSTIADQLRQDAAAQTAAWQALRARAVATEIIDDVLANLGALETSLAEVSVASAALADAQGSGRLAATERVLTAAQGAQSAALAASGSLEALSPGDVVLAGNGDATVGLWAAQMDSAVVLAAVVDELRELALSARRRSQAGSRLYLVRRGDTVESIARTVLGSAGRAAELGLRPDELVPGTLVWVPAP